MAGCTFTSTLAGFIFKFNITNPNFPIGIKPLYACSVADVNVLSFIYLLLTKNSWLVLFDLAISGFPITPLISISSKLYETSIIPFAISFPYMLYTTSFKLPLPFVCITVLPVLISFIATLGFTNAILVITSSIYPDSV